MLEANRNISMKIWKIADNGFRVTLCNCVIPEHIWQEASEKLKVCGGLFSVNSKDSLAYAFKMEADKKDIRTGMFIGSTQFFSWNNMTKKVDRVNPLTSDKWDGYIVLDQTRLDTLLNLATEEDQFGLVNDEEIYRELGLTK